MRPYFDLVKPGMVASNTLVALSAFIFGSQGAISWDLFFYTLFGVAFIVASACVFNNIYDRGIDARMERTRDRALANGSITPRSAFFLGAALLLAAIFFLWQANSVALFFALLGCAVYVLLYTPLKHRSSTALYVGAVAGAMPPVIGYTAATGSPDLVALLLFTLLFLWQIPHFVAIALYRFEEYSAAGVPLVVTRPPSARVRTLARRVFFDSLIVLLALCVLLVLAPYAF